MLRSIGYGFAGLAVTVLCSCAARPSMPSPRPAPPPVAGVAESYDYECDTPAGHYADWMRTLSANRAQVRGSLLFKEGREHPTARPVANVLLSGADASQTFGLRAQVLSSNAELLQIDLVGPMPAKAVLPIVTLPWKGQAIDFELTLNARGEVELAADGRRVAMDIGALSLSTLSLGCSTADAHFAHVTVNTEY